MLVLTFLDLPRDEGIVSCRAVSDELPTLHISLDRLTDRHTDFQYFRWVKPLHELIHVHLLLLGIQIRAYYRLSLLS